MLRKKIIRVMFPISDLEEPSLTFSKAEYALAAPIDARIYKELKNRACNIFHAHSPFNSGVFAAMMARRMDIPVVATFHSKYWSDAYQYTHSTLAADLMAKWVVSFYQSCDAVWACSEAVMQKVSMRQDTGIWWVLISMKKQSLRRSHRD